MNLSNRVIVYSASLAAISAVTQLVHIGYRSPQWGMWIDVVAVTWIAAYLLFGIRSVLLVSLLGALIITLFAPDTWLGASMKWIATLPMWTSLYLWQKYAPKKIKYDNISSLIIPLLFGLTLRSLIIIPLNYFYAIPIWTGMTSNQAISTIPWFVIAGFNTAQGILDVVLAWILVYRFKLSRYAS